METLVEKVLAYGDTMPQKTSICFKETKLSYGELKQRIIGMAEKLISMGIKSEDRVMLSAISKPEYVAALLAIQYIGAIAVPIDKFARAETMLDIWKVTDAVLFLTDGKKLDECINVCSLKNFYGKAHNYKGHKVDYKRPKEKQLCELLFTTGTAGRPKGVMLSYKCVYVNMLNTWHGIGMEESDIVLNPLPLNHSFGMRVLRSTLFIGATAVLQNGFTFAKEIENNILVHNCTAMVCVPASIEVIYRQMQEQFVPIMGKLRYIEFSAGSVNIDMKKKLLKELPNTTLFNTWGSTETGGVVFLNMTEYPDKLASIGRPIKDVALKTVNQKGETIVSTDINTAGRMLLRGGMLMEGYWREKELTENTIKDDWLYTSDIVYCDNDDFIYILGRADDIINVGGEKVSPIEVENTAQEYKEIRECGCIGVADKGGILGEVPILFVVAENGIIEEDALLKYLAENIEKYKLPHEIIQLDALPRNAMNKLDRKVLRQLYKDRSLNNLMNPVICNLLARRSVREFNQQPIDMQLLNMILKAGYYAPSGHNMQTWRFTVLMSLEKIQKLKELVKTEAGKAKVNFYGFENPQVLILVSNDRRNTNGIQDSSCAVENIMLAAASYGIGSVWLNPLMTLCDVPEIREMLNSYDIPSQHIVWAMVALGYPKTSGKLLAKKENVVRYID